MSDVVNSEYSFWWRVKNNKTPFENLNAEQQQAYLLLENKIALYGAGSLNKNGWGWDPNVKTPYGGINEGESSSEPEMVNSFNEIPNNLYSKVDKVEGQPNMYLYKNNVGARRYYFVVPKLPSLPKKEQKPTSVSISKTKSAPKAGTSTTYSGPTKPTKTMPAAIKEIPSQYDLLFNSLNYMSVGEAEIEKISMDLIFAGDDLLTDFDYRSIDYLPDFEISTKNKYGDYVDVLDVFKNNDNLNELKANSEFSIKDPVHLDGKIDELISELKSNLENQTSPLALKHFGTETAAKGFLPYVSKGDYLDFSYNLDDKYNNYTITIDFNPI